MIKFEPKQFQTFIQRKGRGGKGGKKRVWEKGREWREEDGMWREGKEGERGGEVVEKCIMYFFILSVEGKRGVVIICRLKKILSATLVPTLKYTGWQPDIRINFTWTSPHHFSFH